MFWYNSKREFLRAYGIITFLAVLSFIVRMSKFQQYGLKFQLTTTAFGFVFVIFFWEALRITNRWLNLRYPFERNISGRIIIQLLIGVAIGLFGRFLIYFFGEPYIPFKLDELFVATTWVLYPLATIVVNLIFFTFYFIDRWKDSIVRAERLEKEKSQVQFDNLKNQLNPHFLFNALTSLNSLIFEDQRLASDFLQQLSKVYRYVLQHKDRNFVSLKTELDFIRHYVSLLETRFHGAVKISFNLATDTDEKAIVPVTLQILIENALKHNVVDKEKPLLIDILTIGDYLVVSNNLQRRKTVESSNKTGLENLKSLYRFLTDRPVVIEETDDRFFVRVPMI